jgi:endonuclease YncB( thermonuclease family)
VTDGGMPLRLRGHDCPETYYAQCESERGRGDAATERLRQLLAGAKKFEIVVGWQTDRYGRQIGRIRVDVKDVGCLAREGLCVPYDGRRPRRDWCG